MAQRVIDMTGKQFGRLTVSRFFECSKSHALWVCHCACGAEKIVRGSNLRSGGTVSCGCISKEHIRNLARTHGLSGTPEHQTWKTMRQRCLHPRTRNYPRYGGRGITVCERWNDFENFLADMGKRPSPKHTLDRMNNDGNYEPGNCRWSTQKEQQTNRTGLRQVIFRGEEMSLGRAIEISGSQVSGVLARHRIDVGWPIEDVLMRPVDTRCRRKEQ